MTKQEAGVQVKRLDFRLTLVPTIFRMLLSVRCRQTMSRAPQRPAGEVASSPLPKVRVALACALVSLVALVGVLVVVPREVDTVAKIADAVLVAVLPVAFGLAWSWRRPLWAWLFASSIAPTYLLLVVLFGLDHFGGWFDLAFIVVCLWGILLAGIGAIVGRVALRRQAHGDT